MIPACDRCFQIPPGIGAIEGLSVVKVVIEVVKGPPLLQIQQVVFLYLPKYLTQELSLDLRN